MFKEDFADLVTYKDYIHHPPSHIGGVATVLEPGSIFHERFTWLYRQFNKGNIKGAMETQRQIVITDRKFEGIPLSRY